MALKLQLVQDGKIIFEMPLSSSDLPREELVNELGAFEVHLRRFSKIFTALSSETRLMMMKRLMEGNLPRFSKIFTALSSETRLMMMKRLMEEKNRTINFTDFMRDLDLNPKIVWENTRKLREGGLLEKIGRGRYRCSEFGETGFIMMSFTLRRLMETLE